MKLRSKTIAALEQAASDYWGPAQLSPWQVSDGIRMCGCCARKQEVRGKTKENTSETDRSAGVCGTTGKTRRDDGAVPKQTIEPEVHGVPEHYEGP